jgi:SAM-dependent methyltransferase
MIAPRELPAEFVAWNRSHGAPFGRYIPRARFFEGLMPSWVYRKWRGPFCLQPNNTTRSYEYPWAFHATPMQRGLRVVEIGGGLSGFQFALDKAGCSVVNVDPGLEAKGVGWPCDPHTIQNLNRVFGTRVELRNTTISHAQLEPESFDRAYSISVLEHLPEDDIQEVMEIVYSCLKPEGYFTITVDLFLNTSPFTSRDRNGYGKNVDLQWLVGHTPFVLVQANRAELFGYPEFDRDRIQSNLEHYFIGSYPALIQCLVLQKPTQ